VNQYKKNMKKITFQIFSLIFILTSSLNGNAQIKYGSNNGKYLTIRGTKLYYEEYGKGNPLILLHGGFGNISDFKKCIPQLSKKYRVIIPDAPGLGRSEHADSIMTYKLMSKYYSNMIDQLKLENVFLIGWSDGGIAALLLAKNRPDKIKKVISCGPNYKANGLKEDEVDFTKNKLTNPDWVENNLKNWVEIYKGLSPQDDWKRYITEANRMWFEEEYFSKTDLEAIKIPTLIVYGDNDMYTLEHGIEIRNAIKNSEFCVLPNTTHDVFMEKPNLINQIAIDFFSTEK
jgi:pimeloyl-ACP methyl ester carboxylesterase